MNKVSVRQALSSRCQWRSYDQETSFQNSIESDTDGIARSFGKLTNADLLRDVNTNLYQKRKVCSTVDWGFLTVSCWSELTEKKILDKERSEDVKYVLRQCRICQKYQGGLFKTL